MQQGIVIPQPDSRQLGVVVSQPIPDILLPEFIPSDDVGFKPNYIYLKGYPSGRSARVGGYYLQFIPSPNFSGIKKFYTYGYNKNKEQFGFTLKYHTVLEEPVFKLHLCLLFGPFFCLYFECCHQPKYVGDVYYRQKNISGGDGGGDGGGAYCDCFSNDNAGYDGNINYSLHNIQDSIINCLLFLFRFENTNHQLLNI